MSIETIKESIFSTTSLDAQALQLPVQQDVIVPDVKPDIDRILQVDSKVIFDDMSVESNRVKFIGRVDCNVLYLSEGPGKTIHNITTTFNIEDFINIDEIGSDSVIRLDGYIENMRTEKLNSRKININCLIEVAVIVEEKFSKSIIVGAGGMDDLQLKKSPFETRQLMANKDEKFIVKDEIGIPSGKTNINEILWCDITIKNKDVKVLDDKIAVKGDLNVCILYSGDNEEQLLEFVEKDVPFNGIIECYGVTQEMYPDIDMKIAKYYLQVMPDLDGEERIVEIEVVAEMNVKIYSVEGKEMIVDLYSPTKDIVVDKENVLFQNLIFKNQMKSNVTETITIRDDLPDIMQVFYVSSKCKIEDIEIENDHVVAEGVIFAKIFYVAADDNNPLCAFDEVIPFRQVIETRNARPDHKVEIKSYVEHAVCNMLSNREIEIRCSMGFDTNVLNERDYELIVDIHEQDKDMDYIEKMPSMVIYVVDDKDTLWDIAKKYNTTMGDIIAINELDNDHVSPGQKLLVVKKLLEY